MRNGIDVVSPVHGCREWAFQSRVYAAPFVDAYAGLVWRQGWAIDVNSVEVGRARARAQQTNFGGLRLSGVAGQR